MINWMKRLGLPRAWQRYAVVAALSVPFAFGLRSALQQLLYGDVAAGAVAYIRERDKQPLSEPLAAILDDARHSPAPTQAHELLGRAAPDFALPDHRGELVGLAEARGEGPAVVVFYLGYFCTHCVAQLFALDEDRALFEELGARVVAVSPDPPKTTAERLRKHGGFGFPVLSDASHAAARAYGAYRPAAGGDREALHHATFVIDRAGRVVWANVGAEPFLDNKTLLRELARAAGVRQ